MRRNLVVRSHTVQRQAKLLITGLEDATVRLSCRTTRCTFDFRSFFRESRISSRLKSDGWTIGTGGSKWCASIINSHCYLLGWICWFFCLSYVQFLVVRFTKPLKVIDFGFVQVSSSPQPGVIFRPSLCTGFCCVCMYLNYRLKTA